MRNKENITPNNKFEENEYLKFFISSETTNGLEKIKLIITNRKIN